MNFIERVKNLRNNREITKNNKDYANPIKRYFNKYTLDPRGKKEAERKTMSPFKAQLLALANRAGSKIEQPLKQYQQAVRKPPISVLGPKFLDKLLPASKTRIIFAKQPAPTAIPTPMPTPTPDPRESWENFASMIQRDLGPQGYDTDTVIRQKALESAYGTSDFAKNRYNYGGVGAYDHDPNQAFTFSSPEHYVDYWTTMVRRKFPEAYQVRGNGRAFIEALKKGGYATDPDYVWKILNTPMYR